ncbi:hypothetical protein HK099_007814 [Clydaea vesicula]|uniref:Velvet domain-containing protein n=1 Tax=Clydaea vesicula TaxID=447962 RepID=A0AAD5TVZ5_9FUNG|nr:hypothetical protein HK099_007814 [Clydaea vesicula]
MLDKNKNNVAEKFTTDTASSKYVLKDGENLVNSNSEFTNQHITFNNNFFPSSSSNGTDTVHEDQSEKVSNSDTTEADQTLILVESSRRRMNEGLPKNRKKDYKIIWRQKPVHARMSGNGAKERRTIDPPPILELMEIVGGELMPIIQENPFTFMRATLYSEDGTISLCELQRGMLKNKATLVGDLVEYSMILTDDLGRTGTFFVFRDLSIKTAGKIKK